MEVSAPPQNFGAGFAPQSVTVGDVDGDGVPDLLVANSITDNLSVILGNGDGSFRSARSYAAGGGGPGAVAVGDFDGDGLSDLVVANIGGLFAPGCLSLLLGNGDGSFQAGRNILAGTWNSVTIDDFNRDGLLDVAATSGLNHVTVMLGNGDGSFQPPRDFGVGSSASSGAVGDFNRDGVPDLSVATRRPKSVS